jgi:uncharacterized protein (TIGR02466 family)
MGKGFELMGSLPLIEYIDIFPLLVTKQDISNYKEEDEVIKEILTSSKLSTHDLIEKGSRAYTNNFLEKYPDLMSRIQGAVDNYADKVGLQRPLVKQSWYIVYNDEGKIDRHNHSGSVVSGAYYPYIEKGYTEIVLENPTMVLRSTDPIISPNNYSTQAKTITVKAGTLILFPSYMYHWTTPNKNGKRCVVSFNSFIDPILD